MSTETPQRRSACGLSSMMERLSPRVYLLRPPPNKTIRGPGTDADAPGLIVIFGWMNAGDGPLAKYVSQYQALFPASAILLVTCTFAGMTFPWIGLREARMAATATRAILEPDDEVTQISSPHSNAAANPPPHLRLLVHVFSNAGSTMLYHLYTAYATTGSSYNGKTAALPLHATIFDSTPAPFTFQTLLQGILSGAPSAAARLAITPAAYIYVALVWVVVAVLRLPDHIGDLGPRAHNDAGRVREADRVYCYGPADRITPAAAVERHAADAEAAGFRVRREVFDGSGHVAHARKHADRYWSVVRRTWDEARFEARP
ncbi:hypothetical protein B0T26DRAFT_719120 [Lasiosphaeria miniovina]|uniref:Indole-diterpene biosynthesis protein PaxU n=1 Tax=Lasiosphaeria miniovina TaxID=1954250 RepID=A0AA40ADP8_9PEZI|nr:uncharacterized protein B0T26DRAFT_719120 [Lasiosphaeria miniovina]KAK0713963.1 hypothetical protein B0T26DRAFT_719120 [Lasiosphaeria miniovina]